VQKKDPVTGEPTGVYLGNLTFRYTLAGWDAGPLSVTVSYQGCNDTLCFMPQTERFTFSETGRPVDPGMVDAVATGPPADQGDALERFIVTGRAAGYLDSDDFLAFLDRVETGEGIEQDALAAFRKRGVWLSVVLILVGGLLLNLTPCVLPMIPINIAIIGAGAAAGSRSRGFLLGTTYGLGISLVYGALGVVVVLTGATFGTLNASPWFNLGIAIVFTVLALAMFDVFSIDLSRRQNARTRCAVPRERQFHTCNSRMPGLLSVSRQSTHWAVSANTWRFRQRCLPPAERTKHCRRVQRRGLRHGLYRQMARGRTRTLQLYSARTTAWF
jgi:thiol:disulfide interchange protein